MSTLAPTRPTAPRVIDTPPRGPSPWPVTTTIDPFRVLRRHILWIIGAAAVGVVLGVVAYFLLARFFPLYSGRVLFEIRPGLSDPGQIGTQDISQDELVLRLAQTETVMLTSRVVLEAAVSNPETQTTSWFQKYGLVRIEDAIDDLEENLAAGVMRSTNLFHLSWSTAEAADVPVVLNNIQRAYIDRRGDIEKDLHLDNLRVFDSQLDETHRDLEDLGQQMKEFIRAHGIVTLIDPKDSQTRTALDSIVDQIISVNASVSLAQSTYDQTAAKLEGTLSPSSDDVLEAERDPVLGRHLQTVLDLETELIYLSRKYQPGHSVLRNMESRLQAAEMVLEVKKDEILRRNLEATMSEVGDQVQSYQKVLESLEDEAEAKEMALRDLAAAQSQYQAMETRREHLEQQRDSDKLLINEVHLMRLRADARRVRVAQSALTPRERSFPKPEVVIPLGMFLALGLTIGLIFLRELTDRRIKSAADLAVVPGAAVLGVIPELEEDPTESEAAELVVRKHPQSVLAEAYRQACAALTEAVERAGHQTVVLVGGLPGAGTTTVATNLAAASAAAGNNVLVVDTNFRRPRLAAAMGVASDGPGLGDLLVGAASIDDAIIDAGPGTSIISAGTPANRVLERLNDDRFDGLVAELRGRFNLIIFDAPPAVVAGEAMVLANKLDAAVLVVRASQEKRGLVARLINQIADARCELLGILLNRPRGTAGGYFKKNFATMAEYATSPPA